MEPISEQISIPNPLSMIDRVIRLGSHAVVSLGFLYGLFYTVPSLTEAFRAEQKELRSSYELVLEKREQTFLSAINLREDRMDARFEQVIAEQKSLTNLLLAKAGMHRNQEHAESTPNN